MVKHRHLLLPYSPDAIKIDPWDLEKATGIFDARCSCGLCVINFTRRTIKQSSLNDWESCISDAICEEPGFPEKGKPGPGFEHLRGNFIEGNWPNSVPSDILMTDWPKVAPLLVNHSPPLQCDLPQHAVVPTRDGVPLTQDYYQVVTKRVPSTYAHSKLPYPSKFLPTNVAPQFAADDVSRFAVPRQPLDLDPAILCTAINMTLSYLSLTKLTIANWDEVIKAHVWNTSPGYPYNARHSTGKMAYAKMNRVVKESLYRSELEWNPTIWNVIAKDEILPKDKALRKVRTILGPSLCHTLLSQKLTLSLTEHMNTHHGQNQIGTSKYHGCYHKTMLMFEGCSVVEYDAKGWDRNVHPALLKVWFYTIWRLLDVKNQETWTALSNVFESIIYSHCLLPTGQVVRKNGGIPSGCSLTSHLNTLVHCTIINYMRVVKEVPYVQICYGDDGLASADASPYLHEFFNKFAMNLDKAFKHHDSIVGAGWLGTTVGRRDGMYVPLGDVEKAVAHAYWCRPSRTKKDVVYEFCVAFSLYAELVFVENTQVFYQYLLGLAKDMRSNIDMSDEFGSISSSEIIGQLEKGEREFKQFLVSKFY